MDEQSPARVWEERYAGAQVWSGEPNRALLAYAADLPPGRALDLGCGEGADAIWLAERGWRVTGVDVSATALGRAAAHARDRGVEVAWVEADLAHWEAPGRFDLVTAFFLHSPVDFPRAEILTRAAAALAPGGVLLIVGHAEFPPWSSHHDHPGFPTPEQALAEAGVGPGWVVEAAELFPREVAGPGRERAIIRDAVARARKGG